MNLNLDITSSSDTMAMTNSSTALAAMASPSLVDSYHEDSSDDPPESSKYICCSIKPSRRIQF